ncbi:hypothetical protein ACWIID_26660 [Streptomyces phaeochromogenes]
MGSDAWMAPHLSAGWLATALDFEMLPPASKPGDVDVTEMPDRSAAEVAEELGGRHLLHYVHESRRGTLALRDRWGPCFVTPTPYSPEEASQYLYLPEPERLRYVAFLICLDGIDAVRGPARVSIGGGIEYYLPYGFTRDDVETRWEVTVR